MKNNILGGESENSPKLNSKFAEQGTSISGYETKGPYHCEDCLHRIGGYKSDLPFCIHPVILKDTKLKSLRTTYNGQKCVEIDMEHGCCKYVKQEKHEEDED